LSFPAVRAWPLGSTSLVRDGGEERTAGSIFFGCHPGDPAAATRVPGTPPARELQRERVSRAFDAIRKRDLRGREIERTRHTRRLLAPLLFVVPATRDSRGRRGCGRRETWYRWRGRNAACQRLRHAARTCFHPTRAGSSVCSAALARKS